MKHMARLGQAIKTNLNALALNLDDRILGV